MDSDFGCGIISAHPALAGLCGPVPAADLASEWRRLPLVQKYPCFDANRARLLNLVTPDEFHRTLAG